VNYVYVYNDENEWDCYQLSYIYDKLIPVDILSGKVALN